MKTIYYLSAFGMITLLACERFVDDEEEPQAQTTQEQANPETLGEPPPQNPLEIGNLTETWEHLRRNGEISASLAAPEANLLYVKFKPRSWEEWGLLAVDTTVAWYDYPMDREPPSNPSTYHDPEIPVGMPTYQYAVVPTDYVFPDVYHAVLQRIYDPLLEEDGDTPPEGGGGDSPTQARHVRREHSEDKQALLREAFKRVGVVGKNMSTGLPSGIDVQQGSESVPSDIERSVINHGTSSLYNGNTTVGHIQVYDDDLRRNVPVPGVKVRVRSGGFSWWRTAETYTDQNGDYRLNLGPVSSGISYFITPNPTPTPNPNFIPVPSSSWTYSLIWESLDVTVHEGDHDSRAGGNYATNGRLRRWDMTITREGSWQQWMYAYILRAAYHYYNGDRKDIRRPPGRKVVGQTILTGSKYGGYSALSRSIAKLRFRMYPYRLLSDAPGTFHCDSDGEVNGLIKMYYHYAQGYLLYGAVIHELAHASHWSAVGSVRYYRILSKAWEVRAMFESWAMGVEVELARLVYPTYRRYLHRRNSRYEQYTGVVIDLVDGRPGYYTYSTAGGRIYTPYGGSYDQVQGYTLRQIEDALVQTGTNNLIGASNWTEWKENIKSNIVGSAYNERLKRARVDRLFHFWGGPRGEPTLPLPPLPPTPPPKHTPTTPNFPVPTYSTFPTSGY